MNHQPTDHEEHTITGKIYDTRLIKRLSVYFLEYWKELSLSILLLAISSILMLAGPYLVKVAIDDYISIGDIRGLNKILIIYIAILVISFFSNGARMYLMTLTGQKVMYKIRTDTFAHLQNMSLSFFDRTPVGRLVTRVVNDVEALNEMFTSGIIVIFGDFFYMAGIAVVMLYMNLNLALAAFAVIPLILFVTKQYRTKARKSYRRIRTYIANINSYLQENISGMSTVQIFCREKENFAKFNRINLENMEEQLRNIFYNAVFYPAIEVFKAVSLGLIIWYGGGKVIQGSLKIGVLAAFIQYIHRFFIPIRDLAEKFNIFQSAMASSERIFHVLDTKEEVALREPEIKIKEVKGKIEFKDVWFSYAGRGGEYVLKGVSFNLIPGESLAIIGATGSGKTSIINILNRFYEIQKGCILLDGNDIRHIDKNDLRSHIGIIQQDVFLFSGSCSRNIGLEDKGISREDIERAAKYVYADSFIKNLSGGYEHELYERGKGISAGQRQLLAFARALVFSPEILIMDEATSNIDTETEYLITDAMKRLIKGRTSIIIAHRLSSIKNVDKVLVLRDGEMIEFGTQHMLIEKKGIFYELLQIQRKNRFCAS